VGDKVWLSLKNIRMDRECRKFDAKSAKYKVTEVISSYSYRLNTLLGVHNVFYVSLLRVVANDLLLL
jgi:hypothetical protein